MSGVVFPTEKFFQVVTSAGDPWVFGIVPLVTDAWLAEYIAATPSTTANTIVKRDAQGSASFEAVSANTIVPRYNVGKLCTVTGREVVQWGKDNFFDDRIFGVNADTVFFQSDEPDPQKPFRSALGGSAIGDAMFTALTKAEALTSICTVLKPSSAVTVNNSTTLVNIPGMSFVVAADTTYFVLLHNRLQTSTGASDIRIEVPSLLNGAISQTGFGVRLNGAGAINAITAITATNLRIGGSSVPQLAPDTSFFAFRTGATGGSAQFQFAQWTAHASNSIFNTTSIALIFTV